MSTEGAVAALGRCADGRDCAAGRDGDTIRVRLKAGRIVAARITNAGLVLSHL